ncbi:hypothetical protein [Methylobacterium brachiatum]|uniref:hypothetical protein n=1 Tax=Methylobacterium brachiatum TaxID=269660 RepID=UPI0013CE7269|nr:hypothetical protein [Methylobacterium brachiatum]
MQSIGRRDIFIGIAPGVANRLPPKHPDEEVKFMLPITPDEQRRLLNLRARARRRGILVKSSAKPLSQKNRGGLMIADASKQVVIAGPTFNLTIDAAERLYDEHLAEEEAKIVADASALIR